MPVLEQVLEKNPEKVKVVFKHYPIRSHRNARTASAAAIDAGKQDKFWEFHDILFENHRKLSPERIRDIAQSFGFDEKAFLLDMKSLETDTRINKDIRDARMAGVSGTPTIFVNGRKLNRRTLPAFQAAIDKELTRVR